VLFITELTRTIFRVVKGEALAKRKESVPDGTKKDTVQTPSEGASGEADTLDAIKTAALRIARLLCELSADSGLFVSETGASAPRRLDTKSLKEFSGVLKEMSAVAQELGQERQNENTVRIEFSDEAMELGE
jgi:hypothetical protein